MSNFRGFRVGLGPLISRDSTVVPLCPGEGTRCPLAFLLFSLRPRRANWAGRCWSRLSRWPRVRNGCEEIKGGDGGSSASAGYRKGGEVEAQEISVAATQDRPTRLG